MAASIHHNRYSAKTWKIEDAIGTPILSQFEKEEPQLQGVVFECAVIRPRFGGEFPIELPDSHKWRFQTVCTGGGHDGTLRLGVRWMRTGSSDFIDASAMPDGDSPVDWLNLPPSASATSLWNSLHDAQVILIRSNLLERTMDLFCEIEHLNEFQKLDRGFQFILQLEGVQSARVLRYAMWPGGCSIPYGLSVEEQRKIVAEYQAKWREESGSWNEFESRITRDDEQVFDISDAAMAMSPKGSFALKLCGHLNYATYHEAYLRFEALKISGSDGKQFELEEFQRLGEKYWEAFGRD